MRSSKVANIGIVRLSLNVDLWIARAI